MKKGRVNSTDSDDPRSATVPPRLSSRLEGRWRPTPWPPARLGGLLALAQPATADIIYHPGSSALREDALDVNLDGTTDSIFFVFQ